MKKILFIVFICTLIISFNIFAKYIPNTGNIIGRLEVNITQDFNDIKLGNYYKAKIFLWDIDRKRNIITYSNESGGFFKFVNLNPGEYYLYRVDLYCKNTSNKEHPIQGLHFGKENNIVKIEEGLKIKAKENTNTPLKTINFNIDLLTDKKNDKIFIPEIKNIYFIEELTKIKSYLQEEDRNNYWKNYKWSNIL